MKKFLLGVIFIIPIIIVVAITAASTIIAIATSPLPETIRIFEEDGAELSDGDEVKLEITDKERFIIIEVGPVLVQDDSLEFDIDEESGDGRLSFRRQEGTDKYLLVPETPGAVSVTIRAAANVNVTRYLVFVINTREITGISIYDESGSEVEEVRILAEKRLFVAVSPVVALDGHNLTWKSSDESVLKVSKNGLVRPVSRGKAYVSVSAVDKLGKTHSDSVLVDASGALVKESKVYTSSEITAGWLYANVILGDSVSLSKIDYTHYVVSDGSNSIEIEIGFCQSGDWGFGDSLDTLYTRSAPYFIWAENLDYNDSSEITSVRFVSNNPEILRVEGNVLVPQKGGEATVTATYRGETKTKTFRVKDNPAVLNLSLSPADARLGIKLTRVWGMYWFDENYNLTPTYKISAGAHNDVVWSVDDQSKAEISQEGLITFKDAARGRKVTVTASAMAYGKPTGVTRSFTFNMLSDNAINVYNFDQLIRANDSKTNILVLQDSIDSHYQVRLNNSLYGNGFKVSAEVRQCENKEDTSRIFFYSYDEDPRHYDSLDTLVVEDIILEGRAEYEKATHVGLDNFRMPNKVVFRHIVARNLHTGIAIGRSKDTLVEGCILGDNYKHAITTVYTSEEANSGVRVTLRNNVFKMSEGPAGIIVSAEFNPDDFNKSVVPEFVVEGFLEIYNWKTEAQIAPAFNVFNIDKMDYLSAYVDPVALNNLVNDSIAELIKSEKMAHLFYTDKNGDRYGSMGIFILGALFKPDKDKITIKDENIILSTLPLSNVGGRAGSMIDFINALTERNGMKINNECYIIGYNFAGREPKVKPGEPVPQNFELYKRLQSGLPQPPDDNGGGDGDYDVC